MESTYRNDARRLAIKRMYEINSPLADKVTIPPIFIDSIIKALYAINNMQNALVGDTLRQIFGHTNFIPGSDSTHFFSASNNPAGAFGLKQVRVTVDNTTPWGAQWLSGNYNTTSNDSVNYLINTHQLKVVLNQYQLYPARTIYIISSPIAINATALAKQFVNFSGVGTGNAYQLTSQPAGNGNRINAIFTNNTTRLSYTFGCGDCPSGCTFGRTWTFNVRTGTDCSVDYIAVEDWGSPIEWLTNPCLNTTVANVLCPPGSATLSTNLSGSNNSYQWQISADGTTFTNIGDDSNYIGTSTPALNLKNIPSAWHGYLYTCFTNGTRGKLTFRIRFINTWSGTSDSAWESAGNWSCGTLPDSNTDVVIKGGTIFIILLPECA